MTPIEDLRLLVRTVASVFPHVTIWHGPARFAWVVNGSVDPHPLDLERLLQRFEDSRIRADSRRSRSRTRSSFSHISSSRAQRWQSSPARGLWS